MRKRKDDSTIVTSKGKFGKDQWSLLLMQLPGLILVLVFSYLPMLGIIIAFKDYRYNLGMINSPWCGLENFRFLFESDTLKLLIRNTLGYNFMFILTEIVVCVVLALCLYGIKSRWSIKIFQTSMFLPFFLSWVVVSYVSHALLSVDYGLINSILGKFGADRVSFYSETKYWPFIFLLFDVWKNMGYKTLMYYGSLLSLDTTLLEAAVIDGCSYMKRIWYIVLPHLRPTIIMLFILSIGGIFRSDYGMFFYLPKESGAIMDVTDVLDTYIMRSIRVTGNLGGSSAAGLMQSVVGLVAVIVTNKIVNKLDKNSALF